MAGAGAGSHSDVVHIPRKGPRPPAGQPSSGFVAAPRCWRGREEGRSCHPGAAAGVGARASSRAARCSLRPGAGVGMLLPRCPHRLSLKNSAGEQICLFFSKFVSQGPKSAAGNRWRKSQALIKPKGVSAALGGPRLRLRMPSHPPSTPGGPRQGQGTPAQGPAVPSPWVQPSSDCSSSSKSQLRLPRQASPRVAPHRPASPRSSAGLV